MSLPGVRDEGNAMRYGVASCVFACLFSTTTPTAWAASSAVDQGAATFSEHCAECHGANAGAAARRYLAIWLALGFECLKRRLGRHCDLGGASQIWNLRSHYVEISLLIYL